ncbi:Tethering factor for nuclear proteasome STS1 [Fusarium oxysporum f. sp. albedinis]|nr:hypothetical protein HZ326_18746 [Fusarium oxysporum f. sp. albedinis]KAJ0138391.1 Tethering factor for nuclear proteasome STS1 [Fusarium oxysporum f. sp. albedinis]
MIYLDTPTTLPGHECSYSLIVLTGSKASPHFWPHLRASKLRPQDPGTQKSRVCGLFARSAFVDAADVAAPVLHPELLLAASLRANCARVRLSVLFSSRQLNRIVTRQF